MIILGLGSNVGDRVQSLRDALYAIHKVPKTSVECCSPLYHSDALLPENAPNDWNKPYLNLAIRCQTQLDPHTFLNELKAIERNLNQCKEKQTWGPRVMDIDILAWDDRFFCDEVLTLPHSELLKRPFALWPLADIAPRWVYPAPGQDQGKTAAELVEKWGSRFDGQAPFHTHQLMQRIDTPIWVGILNITPDSFSDGNQYLELDKAMMHAKTLVDGGAEIIDIGAESTSPYAQPISYQEEWERLEPVIQSILTIKPSLIIPPKICIDTRHPEVAEKAIALGVDWINDVSGLDNDKMKAIIASSNVDCIIMHHLAIPEDRHQVIKRQLDPVDIVYQWGEKRLFELEKAGISPNRLIFDPGIGFGKMAEQSFLVLKGMKRFQSLGLRLLVGHSRKTFLSLFTNRPFPERDVETLSLCLFLMNQGVNYLRVHDVLCCARGLNVYAMASATV